MNSPVPVSNSAMPRVARDDSVSSDSTNGLPVSASQLTVEKLFRMRWSVSGSWKLVGLDNYTVWRICLDIALYKIGLTVELLPLLPLPVACWIHREIRLSIDSKLLDKIKDTGSLSEFIEEIKRTVRGDLLTGQVRYWQRLFSYRIPEKMSAFLFDAGFGVLDDAALYDIELTENQKISVLFSSVGINDPNLITKISNGKQSFEVIKSALRSHLIQTGFLV